MVPGFVTITTNRTDAIHRQTTEGATETPVPAHPPDRTSQIAKNTTPHPCTGPSPHHHPIQASERVLPAPTGADRHREFVIPRAVE